MAGRGDGKGTSRFGIRRGVPTGGPGAAGWRSREDFAAANFRQGMRCSVPKLKAQAGLFVGAE